LPLTCSSSLETRLPEGLNKKSNQDHRLIKRGKLEPSYRYNHHLKPQTITKIQSRRSCDPNNDNENYFNNKNNANYNQTKTISTNSFSKRSYKKQYRLRLRKATSKRLDEGSVTMRTSRYANENKRKRARMPSSVLHSSESGDGDSSYLDLLNPNEDDEQDKSEATTNTYLGNYISELLNRKSSETSVANLKNRKECADIAIKIGSTLPSPIPYLPEIDSSTKGATISNNINSDAGIRMCNQLKQCKLKFDFVEKEHDHADQIQFKQENKWEILNIKEKNRKLDTEELLSLNLNKKSSVTTDSDYRTQSSSGATNTDNEAATAITSTSSLTSSVAALPMRSESNQHREQRSQQELEKPQTIDMTMIHMDACEKLLNLEELFIELMQNGVQQYSRPLRHCQMITAMQHHLLFQNIEKILAISEYQLNQLMSQDESMLLDVFNSIGKLYENKMRMSCEAFDLYLNGIESAFALFNTLINPANKNASTANNFSKFLLDSRDDIDMDLITFLLLPLYYVGDIYECLTKIKDSTPQINNDHACIASLLDNLFNFVDRANIILDKYNGGQSKNPFATALKRQKEQENQSNNEHCSSDCIYSSQLYYRQSSHKWKLINLFLFDGMIALARNECVFLNDELIKNDKSENVLKIIRLSDICKCEFDLSKSKEEFQLIYFNLNSSKASNNKKNRKSTQTLRFRVANKDEKQKWKSLLDQRIK
jgi:hypothetical protein